MSDFITQIEPWIDNRELDELKRVVDSTYVVEHNLTKEFEEMICEMTGSKYAVAMTNGTVALYAALKALNIGHGDEVIIPNLTFIATANAIIMAGAKPIFCEIDKDDLGISPKKIISLINKNTKAIMPVHLYGYSCKMDEILEISKVYDLNFCVSI